MTKIIGGKYKGTHLLVPKGNLVRPTSSIKKEALFNIITSHLLKLNDKTTFANKIILDAFAGSGALGLEALSRGANYCYFIEKNKITGKFLKKNCDKILNKNQYEIFNINYYNMPSDLLYHNLDIVFFDPPYDYKIDESLFSIISKKANKSCIYIIEMSNRSSISKISHLKIFNERIFGKTKISFLTKK